MRPARVGVGIRRGIVAAAPPPSASLLLLLELRAVGPTGTGAGGARSGHLFDVRAQRFDSSRVLRQVLLELLDLETAAHQLLLLQSQQATLRLRLGERGRRTRGGGGRCVHGRARRGRLRLVPMARMAVGVAVLGQLRRARRRARRCGRVGVVRVLLRRLQRHGRHGRVPAELLCALVGAHTVVEVGFSRSQEALLLRGGLVALLGRLESEDAVARAQTMARALA